MAILWWMVNGPDKRLLCMAKGADSFTCRRHGGYRNPAVRNRANDSLQRLLSLSAYHLPLTVSPA
jgi:hypothetical protein